MLAELGRGGMGVVYRVRAAGGGEAALKLLLGTDEATFARFERERRLLASLGEAEGFVGLVDAGTSREGAWLVMPFVAGGTLRSRLERGPLGVEETVSLGLQLATALGKAHERGIVHRDVKPENVLFTASGRALLADLGLAKHFDRSAPGGSQSLSMTRAGSFKGTAGYVAPEQLANAATVGPRADVFALGAVLYECLCGRPAFRGDTVVELLAELSSGTREPIRRPGVPPWLEEVVGRALAVDARDRFADGTSLARALEPRAAAAPGRRRSVLLSLALGTVAGGALLCGLLVATSRSPSRPASRPVLPRETPRVPERASPPSPRVDSDAAREHESLAEQRARAGDWDGVLEEATKAVELDPGLARAWALRGAASGRSGDWDAAIAHSTRAIELDPALIMAWSNRGTARGCRGDADGAIADLTRAIELDPGDGRTYANRALARSKKKDWDGVIADATRAIELAPDVATSYQARGNARGMTGDWDGAIADASRAIELDPRLPTAWATRAQVLRRSGDADGGIADATRAIELDPGLATGWTNRGLARHARGDWSGAASDLERSLELFPEGPDSEDVRRALDDARKRLRR